MFRQLLIIAAVGMGIAVSGCGGASNNGPIDYGYGGTYTGTFTDSTLGAATGQITNLTITPGGTITGTGTEPTTGQAITISGFLTDTSAGTKFPPSAGITTVSFKTSSGTISGAGSVGYITSGGFLTGTLLATQLGETVTVNLTQLTFNP